jgi:exopolyphosphatase/pppGpp-phosphohydrolase
LNLSDAQRTELAALTTRVRSQMQAVVQATGGALSPTDQARLQQIGTEHRASFLAVLTEPQRRQLAENLRQWESARAADQKQLDKERATARAQQASPVGGKQP